MKKEWLFLKYDVNPNVLICQRCKKEQVMPEGSTPINIFLAIMKSFNKIHRKCKKVERI